MLTNDDIKKLMDRFLDVFATRYDLVRIEEKMATKDDLREIMTKVENIFTEVKKITEEQSAHFEEHRRVNDRLDKIERVPAIAHDLR